MTWSPIRFEDCNSIKISLLKSWGYLKSNQVKSGTILWSINGNPNGSVSVWVSTLKDSFIELIYNWNGKPVQYKIPLVTIASNLGSGKVWYFLCPRTQKRCRKLYLVDGFFFHREAFKGCLYEKQTYSHRARKINRLLNKVIVHAHVNDELTKKYFKTKYRGDFTRRYLMLQNKFEKAFA
jgi:hypothetical protein